jgi:hypothetical protein
MQQPGRRVALDGSGIALGIAGGIASVKVALWPARSIFPLPHSARHGGRRAHRHPCRDERAEGIAAREMTIGLLFNPRLDLCAFSIIL